ncbi:MAG: PaaI family thioesterase [Myxococcota bacterium]
MVSPQAINELIDNLGILMPARCVSVTAHDAVAKIVPTPEAYRPGGYISGPTQFGVADAALWFLVFGAIGRIEPMALTSELSIRFLRPAEGQQLFGRARLDKAGRRLVVGTISVWTDQNEDRPCATAQGTYALPHSTS